MIVQSPNNPHSHLTVKERKWPSFPTKKLLAQGLVKGKVLDFGCGTGIDVNFLRANGFDTMGYDPHYAPDYPAGKFDTILCHYVLNVLLPEEQVQVLMSVSELLKPTGKAYFTVRRDVKLSGFRNHTQHDRKVYQCNVILPFKSIILAEHCEVYEYQHFNQLAQPDVTNCSFCNPMPDMELISESATVYALLYRYPMSKGHTIIVPKQHVVDYFDLSDRSKTACWLMVDRAKMILKDRFLPDGFNISINVGVIDGQPIPHTHIHLIPRYGGQSKTLP